MSVTFNKAAVMMRIKQAAEGKALHDVSQQVLKNCNEYCPRDQGILISSSITHSQPEKGKLIWRTPYARHLYYGIIMVDPVTGKACFPIGDQLYSRKGVKKVKSDREFTFSRGQKLWCRAAKKRYKKDWNKLFQEKFSEEMKK